MSERYSIRRLSMLRRFAVSFMIAMLMAVFSGHVAAQKSGPADDGKCEGPVYEVKAVSRPAKITFRAEPTYTAEARAKNIRGRVVLSAVLCKSGHVTHIQVVEGLGAGLTEKAIEAARKIEFKPAEKDGVEVSQATQFEYRFSLSPPDHIPGHGPLAKEPVENRNVEVVAFVGLTCRSSRELWAHIKTRTQSPYHKEQGNQDLQALLALGYLDSERSYLRIEEGDKGGINVVFILKELPSQGPCDR